MLTENDVVGRVCEDLSARGWTIVGRSLTTQMGVDITAEKDGVQLLVEAKGEGSSKPGTSRYGLVFNRGQVKTHVGVAVVTALKVVAAGNGMAGIAVPDNLDHRAELGAVAGPLHRLGIAIFWVASNEVCVDSPTPI